MYEVGQVLFVISAVNMQVVPVRIVEQIVRRTVNGEKIEHEVSVPGKSDRYMLSKIKGRVCSSTDEVKQIMMQNASKSITTLIEKATSKAEKYFSYTPSDGALSLEVGDNEDVRHSTALDTPIGDMEEGYVAVELENGQKARMKVA